jgi:FAD-dependent urate hydroxylase
MNDLKAVIVGAGMGGLTAGIALRQAGYEVEIYDRVTEMRPVGAGISLWSNGVKVLNRLGLGKEIAQIGGLMDRMQYRSHTDALLSEIDLAPLVANVGQRPYPVARADLQQMLLAAFPGDVQLGHQCVAIEQDEQSVTAIFANGHRATGDVLVAADGIHSISRQYVLGETVEPQYGGYVNWNGLVPVSSDLADKDLWVIYVGEYKRASMMPVGGDRFYFFFDMPMPKEAALQPGEIRTDLTTFFASWPKPVQTLIERLETEKTNRVLIHDIGPLKGMVRGRVALLGDSAHATCPDLGQGGCQAMEDSLVLTHYLMTTTISVADALKRYEAERKERTTAIVQKARSRAEEIHGKNPQVTHQWYEQLRQEPPSGVTQAIAKIILGGPMR